MAERTEGMEAKMLGQHQEVCPAPRTDDVEGSSTNVFYEPSKEAGEAVVDFLKSKSEQQKLKFSMAAGRYRERRTHHMEDPVLPKKWRGAVLTLGGRASPCDCSENFNPTSDQEFPHWNSFLARPSRLNTEMTDANGDNNLDGNASQAESQNPDSSERGPESGDEEKSSWSFGLTENPPRSVKELIRVAPGHLGVGFSPKELDNSLTEVVQQWASQISLGVQALKDVEDWKEFWKVAWHAHIGDDGKEAFKPCIKLCYLIEQNISGNHGLNTREWGVIGNGLLDAGVNSTSLRDIRNHCADAMAKNAKARGSSIFDDVRKIDNAILKISYELSTHCSGWKKVDLEPHVKAQQEVGRMKRAIDTEPSPPARPTKRKKQNSLLVSSSKEKAAERVRRARANVLRGKGAKLCPKYVAIKEGASSL